MEKITQIKHNNTHNNRKNQTSVVLVAVLFALAMALVAGPTVLITIQKAHAKPNCDVDACGGASHGIHSTLDPSDLEPYRPCGPNCW